MARHDTYLNFLYTSFQWTTGTGANGHWYEVFTSSTAISWTEAKTAAQGKSWQGIQGNLASITSGEENSFVAGLFAPTDWVYNN